MTSTQVYSASTSIQFFSVDSVGNLYLPDTTAGFGILKVSLPSQTSTTFGSITSIVNGMVFDNADNLYVFTNLQIYRINIYQMESTITIKRIKKPEYNNTPEYNKAYCWPPAQRAAGQLPTTPLPRHGG
jgi:hypothetical protein